MVLNCYKKTTKVVCMIERKVKKMKKKRWLGMLMLVTYGISTLMQGIGEEDGCRAYAYAMEVNMQEGDFPTNSEEPVVSGPAITSSPELVDGEVTPTPVVTEAGVVYSPKPNEEENQSSEMSSFIPKETLPPVDNGTPIVGIEETIQPTLNTTDYPTATPIVGNLSPTNTPIINREPIATKQPEATPIATTLPSCTDEPQITSRPGNGDSANSSASDVEVTEKPSKYCKINYVLNGGKNHQRNPRRVQKSGFRLRAAKRVGYTFVGWYKESLCIHSVNYIQVGGKTKVTYYAKWKKVTVAKAKILSVKRTKSGINVKVKANSGEVGYEYSYALTPNMAKRNFVRSLHNPKLLSKVRKNKTYYIVVRTYKLDSYGRKIYGKYSKIAKCKA